LKYLYTTTLTIVSGVIVAIVNKLLVIILAQLGNFSRYATITLRTVGITLTVFIAMFVNTALITILLNGEIYGFNLSKYIANIVPPLK